jgi:hypothetical protein
VRPPRGALEGAAAALAWAACEPLLARACGTRFSDVRLLGALTTRGSGWPLAGLAVHAANGAAFGVAFARLGGGSPGTGVLVAELENLAAWPLMLVADRVHPDRREGRWGPLARDRRVFAQEVAGHAVFGAVLGALLARRATRAGS